MQVNWMDSVFSDGSIRFVSNPLPQLNEKITISIRMLKDSPVEKAYIRYTLNGEERVVELEEKDIKGNFIYYWTRIKIEEPVLKYHFILCTRDNVYYYNQMGLFEHFITEDYDFKLIADFEKPSWVDDAIFYQIFVDRFYNGNTENDVKDGEYTYRGFSSKKMNWQDKPGKYEIYGNLDFFGGDLEGIAQKIDYLKELGVNALYLNPIFEAPSNHKYDCADYFSVDKHFGGNRALEQLNKKLHEEDMKIILDISINHTGDTHHWFKEKRDFYYFYDDENYESWCGVKSLPVLKYENPEVRNAIYKDEKSVLKYWLTEPYCIDGWRFDVGHYTAKVKGSTIYREIWREIRRELKTLNKDAYLIAEHWTDAEEYLQGDMWDSIMNYFGFFRPVRKYLGENDLFTGWKIKNPMKTKNGINFSKEVMQHFARLPYIIQGMQFNLLSSHDVHRFHNSPTISRKNILTGIVMLLTFIGIPCIYYGDEIGLEGDLGDLSNCRYPFNWDEKKWDKEIYETYKRLIALRRKEKVLIDGSFKILTADDSSISYARFNEDEAIIFINSQDKEERTIYIPLLTIGDFNNFEVIFNNGEESEIAYENGLIVVNLKPEQTYLIKFYR
ncbi:alpha-amylase family glycosyl hydrolase [Caloramator sp. CAR-1]|uniref:alpha-amylase family glycosyl hydrolase n=2 Tax=unclassified Caloramator TaxID=2629145 RepID=UPI0026E2D0D7|nr:alpha-amylase family glycosyl hydrolase [Caloramator sp. CAR-1]MDO6353683.1 alpha-amylase family glycosyl hydrolase [Caloramator sp. CAR-1]